MLGLPLAYILIRMSSSEQVCSLDLLAPSSAPSFAASPVARATTEVVIAGYRNSTPPLLLRFQSSGYQNVLLLLKGTDKGVEHVPVNKGNEASAYLKYIIDHYDSLPTHVAFVHEQEYSWHHNSSIVSRLDSLVGTRLSYSSLNSAVCCPGNQILWTFEYYEVKAWWKQYLEQYLGAIELLGDFRRGHTNCAQFVVAGTLIHAHKRSMYVGLYEWLLTTDLPSSQSGRYLEWTWHILWGQYDEPRFSNI